MLYFLNLRWCRIFFSVSFDAIVFRISSYSAFSSFVLSIQSVWSILSCFSLMVLSQNITIWFINAKENPFRLEYHLSIPGRNFLLLVQERVVHLSEKLLFWCVSHGNLYVKHTLLIFVSISSIWLLIHSGCPFYPMVNLYMAYHFILLRLNLFGLRVDREGWWFEYSMS